MAFHPTRDLLQAAEVIAGAELFIGNQSCPRAIAEGLKVAVVQETDRSRDNCHWERPNAWYGYRSCVHLPDLSAAGGDLPTLEEPPPLVDAQTFEQGGSGIGDGLMGMLAVEGWRRENPGRPVVYRVSGTAQHFVKLFDACDRVDIQSKGHNEHGIQDAVQVNIGWLGAQSGGGTMISRYCRNTGTRQYAIPNLKNPGQLRVLGERYKEAVFLAPFSESADRTYPRRKWVELMWALIDSGHRPVVVHNSVANTADFHCERLLGSSAQELAGAFMNGRCLIGNDSGPAHLAGLVGLPTLVLWGTPTRETIYNPYPSVKCLNDKPLHEITPRQIFTQFESLINSRGDK